MGPLSSAHDFTQIYAPDPRGRTFGHFQFLNSQQERRVVCLTQINMMLTYDE